MNFVSLTRGKIQISFADSDKKHTFKPTDHERIGDLIAKHRAWTFMCSSSCDFPHESGFPKSFDVGAVLAKAVEFARERVAIAVERVPIGDVSNQLDRIVKEAEGTFPLSLKFVNSGKKEDVILTFDEERDFEYFTGGIRFSARLVACTNGGACTNESASATPNGALTAGRPATTHASKRTSGTHVSRTPSTAGSAKRVGRSARTTKGSSPKTQRAKGGSG